jgi:hypothetical protein
MKLVNGNKLLTMIDVAAAVYSLVVRGMASQGNLKWKKAGVLSVFTGTLGFMYSEVLLPRPQVGHIELREEANANFDSAFAVSAPFRRVSKPST